MAAWDPASPFAWKDDPRALSAVQAALPLLRRAEAVVVLAGVRAGAPPPGVPAVLTQDHLTAEVGSLPLGPRGTFGAVLLAAAEEVGAGLLVMGA